MRAEEKLLREAFGSKFDEYAGRVPAFFPGVF
jgi:protein-S-isoprenylcysteine O-methyltransferase Ste14